MGRRKDYSSPAFARVFFLWKAWEKGIPPAAGGVSEQNPFLVAAFEAIDQARGRAERERQERWEREARRRGRR